MNYFFMIFLAECVNYTENMRQKLFGIVRLLTTDSFVILAGISAALSSKFGNQMRRFSANSSCLVRFIYFLIVKWIGLYLRQRSS